MSMHMHNCKFFCISASHQQLMTGVAMLFSKCENFFFCHEVKRISFQKNLKFRFCSDNILYFLFLLSLYDVLPPPKIHFNVYFLTRQRAVRKPGKVRQTALLFPCLELLGKHIMQQSVFILLHQRQVK